MGDLEIVATRGSIAESAHPVSSAVVDTDGRLIASTGDPDFVTFWRSASKAFQLFPLVTDGGIERFGLDDSMLALACGSHNGEPVHREIGQRWLDAIGVPESALACGGHLSLWPALSNETLCAGTVTTPLWSNCSGKHAALVALAVMHGWPVAGYEDRAHPVQKRVEDAVAQFARVAKADLVWGVDGCTAAAVALPLSAMARAYCALGASSDRALTAIRSAMIASPYMIAGAERLDTIVMQAWPGEVVIKIGAEGVYSAAFPSLGIALSLKVHDGDMKAAAIALVALMDSIMERYDRKNVWDAAVLDRWRRPPIRNTRGAITGQWEARGAVQWR